MLVLPRRGLPLGQCLGRAVVVRLERAHDDVVVTHKTGETVRTDAVSVPVTTEHDVVDDRVAGARIEDPDGRGGARGRRGEGVAYDHVVLAAGADASALVEDDSIILKAVDQVVLDHRALKAVSVDAVLAVVVNHIIFDQGVCDQTQTAFAHVTVDMDSDIAVVMNDVSLDDGAIQGPRKIDPVPVVRVPRSLPVPVIVLFFQNQ